MSAHFFINGLIIFAYSVLFFSREAIEIKQKYDNFSEEKKEISSLDFPYRKGYFFILEGEAIQYDAYNFPKKKEQRKIRYDFFEGKNNSVCIKYKDKIGRDSTVYNTFLIINKN